MTISSTSTSASCGTPPALSDDMKTRMQDFRALARALKSGDLDGAKQAFETFKKDLASSGDSDPIFGDSNSQASKDLAAVGKALESGDVDAAKEAFSSVQKDMRASRPGGPKGPPPPKPAAETDASSQVDFQALLESATSSTQSADDTSSRSFSAYA